MTDFAKKVMLHALEKLSDLNGLTDNEIALKCILQNVIPCAPKYTAGVLRAYAALNPRPLSPLERVLSEAAR